MHLMEEQKKCFLGLNNSPNRYKVFGIAHTILGIVDKNIRFNKCLKARQLKKPISTLISYRKNIFIIVTLKY